MSSELLYSEIIEEFTNAATKQEKINILRKNGDPRFKFFLELILNPKVEWDVVIPEKYRPACSPIESKNKHGLLVEFDGES